MEAQVIQQATSSSTPPCRILSKPKPNPCGQCNGIFFRGGLEGFEGGEVHKAMTKEQSNKLETITSGEGSSPKFPEESPPKLKDPCSFSISCLLGNVSIARALCDIGSSVSLMPYSIFQKLHLG